MRVRVRSYTRNGRRVRAYTRSSPGGFARQTVLQSGRRRTRQLTLDLPVVPHLHLYDEPLKHIASELGTSGPQDFRFPRPAKRALVKARQGPWSVGKKKRPTQRRVRLGKGYFSANPNEKGSITLKPSKRTVKRGYVKPGKQATINRRAVRAARRAAKKH